MHPVLDILKAQFPDDVLSVQQDKDRGDLSARAFRTFDRRQRARYRSFRRFVRGFYTREFRDLFFSPDPPPRLFRSVVSVFAGYWRPSLVTRFWVAIFFLIVRLQARFGIVPPHMPPARISVAEMTARRRAISSGTSDRP